MEEVKGTNYRAMIQAVRGQYLRGDITLDEAKAKVQPWLDVMNQRGAELAKQHEVPFKPFRFSYVFR